MSDLKVERIEGHLSSKAQGHAKLLVWSIRSSNFNLIEVGHNFFHRKIQLEINVRKQTYWWKNKRSLYQQDRRLWFIYHFNFNLSFVGLNIFPNSITRENIPISGIEESKVWVSLLLFPASTKVVEWNTSTPSETSKQIPFTSKWFAPNFRNGVIA